MMIHDVTMASAGDRLKAAGGRLFDAIAGYGAALAEADGPELGEGLIVSREASDRLEAVFTGNLRRFDRSGDYASDGALDVVAWVRSKCRLSGGSAAERVAVGRQLEQLPQTQQAFAAGELGYQHAAVLARTAEHVGAEAVRKDESVLLKAAQTMDPGQFVGVAKDFEHRVDAEAVLVEANRAHQRRYLRVSEARDGIVQLDGLLDAEAGAIVRNAVNGGGPPSKDDHRTPEQRRADRLVELCDRAHRGGADGSGSRPHLIIRASIDTLVGAANAPAGELDGGGPIPAETVRRLACDSALTRIIGKGELDGEISRASRTIPPATRRALAERDRGCVADSCNRRPEWTDAHHIQHWIRGGPTAMSNLLLLCRPHHRMVHEEGWGLDRLTTGRWALTPPVPHSRSA
jgi:uncharacterized protein DUF222/HNH endonuclease